jgi:hypothetical protein
MMPEASAEFLSAPCVPVAIVGSGAKHHSKVIRAYESRLQEENVYYIRVDLRTKMPDPLKQDRVRPEEDATHAKTIVAVMGQHQFPVVIEETLALLCTEFPGQPPDVRKKGAHVLVNCYSGYHRNDSFTRVFESLLNMCKVADMKIFNAQRFTLVGKYPREYGHELNMAMLWSRCPWTLLSIEDKLFGEYDCRSRPDARSNWQKINSLIMPKDFNILTDGLHHTFQSYMECIDVTFDPNELWQPNQYDAEFEPLHEDLPDDIDAVPRPPDAVLAGPRPPQMPPSQAVREAQQAQSIYAQMPSPTSAADVNTPGDHQADMPHRPVPSSRMPPPPPPAVVVPSDPNGPPWMSPQYRRVEPMQPWETFEFSLDNYRQVLDDCGADRQARMELFQLAQLQCGGRDAANSIVHKLKNNVDGGRHGEKIHNYSAYIHSHCVGMRHKLAWWLYTPAIEELGFTASSQHAEKRSRVS